MARDVIIVESEQKARTIAAQLSGGVETLVLPAVPVKATLLPSADPLKKEPPRFTFTPADGQQNLLARLLDVVTATLYLAFDSDQRGEYWAWLINEYLLAETNGMHGGRRLHLFGFSRGELQRSFRLVEPVDSDKAVAYHLRLFFNAHLGRHLKRLLGTTTGPQGLPLTGDALATIFLLAEREAEIRAFAPPVKWQVRVRLAADGGEFDARLEEAYGVTFDGYVRDALQGKELVGMFRGQPFVVSEVAEEEIRIEPPGPFRLLELLQEAYLVHKLPPAGVLAALRQLYEGVGIAGEEVGLVSSFSTRENSDAQPLWAKVRAQVVREFGPGALATGDRESEMGGALLPLRPDLGPAALAGVLSPATQQIYGLIHARALASQMREAEGMSLAVGLHAGESCYFRASGRAIREAGFLAACQGREFRELLAPSPLAGLSSGQEVRNIQIIPEQAPGFPPEYYTFEGLAGDLADFSLDLDAAGIALLQRLLDGGYAALMPDGTLRCRENSATLINVMNKAFPSMKGVNLSAYFEQVVAEAVSGRKPLALALHQFDQTMMMQGNVLAKIAMPAAPRLRGKTSRSIIKSPGVEAPPPGPPSPPGEVAAPAAVESPLPAAPPVEEVAPVAEEIAAVPEAALPATMAPEVPEVVPPPETVAEPEEPVRQEVFAQVAKESAPLMPEPPSPAVELHPAGPGKPCPDCGRPLLLKEDRFGKYWFCSGHPECRHSESYGKEGGPSLRCPLCQTGNIVSKHTPTGKPFYVCPEPDCEFMAWSRPHAISCRICDSPFLVEKKNLAGKISLRCPRAGCNYTQSLPGEKDIASAGEAPASPGQAPVKKKVLIRRVRGGVATGGVRKVRVVRRKA